MEIQEAISQRRAVRDYTPAQIDRATMLELIKAATWAPSAMNEQAWQFTVIADRALLLRISRSAKAHMLNNVTTGPHASHFHEILGDANRDIFYGAPGLVVISAPKLSQWAVEDCSLAAQNFTLAAWAHGLGTCWIGFAQSWLSTPEGLASIQLDSSYLPVAPIIVGHPKAMPVPVPRTEPHVH